MMNTVLNIVLNIVLNLYHHHHHYLSSYAKTLTPQRTKFKIFKSPKFLYFKNFASFLILFYLSCFIYYFELLIYDILINPLNSYLLKFPITLLHLLLCSSSTKCKIFNSVLFCFFPPPPKKKHTNLFKDF